MLTVDPIDLTHAPGCFGSALMCRPETAECETCIFVDRCAPLSAAKRDALHAKFGVTVKPPKAKKPVKAKGAEPVLVSVKTAELITRVEKAGITVTDNLRAGINPFTKPAFLRVACHLLLRVPQGFNRETLVMAFTTKLGWERERALAGSAQAIEFLTALGAADFVNGRLALRKNP